MVLTSFLFFLQVTNYQCPLGALPNEMAIQNERRSLSTILTGILLGVEGWELDGVGCWMAVGDLGGHCLGGDIAVWSEAVGCGQSGLGSFERDWLGFTLSIILWPHGQTWQVLTRLQVYRYYVADSRNSENFSIFSICLA